MRGAARTNRHRRSARSLALISLALCVQTTGLHAQSATTPAPAHAGFRGVARRRAARARGRRRSRASARTPPAHIRAHSRRRHTSPARRPRRARATTCIEQMRAMGLRDRGAHATRVCMPHAIVRAAVAHVRRREKELPLAEPPVAGDSTSATWQYPDRQRLQRRRRRRRGEVVYVNYGLIEDYARLDSLGVSVRGSIAVARYGRSFRGIKAREAERHGAAALLIYSDPQDDGYVRGDVYPEGPMRNRGRRAARQRVQRRGRSRHAGLREHARARRDSPIDRMAIPRIPVVPISYGERERAAARRARPRRPGRMAGRTPVPLSRRPRARARARARRPTTARRSGTKPI